MVDGVQAAAELLGNAGSLFSLPAVPFLTQPLEVTARACQCKMKGPCRANQTLEILLLSLVL